VSVEEQREAIAEANISSVANPVTLGLTTNGIVTFLAGAVAAGFYAPASIGYLIPIGFLFGGVVQLLAGMWAFRKNDSLSATVFSSYGAFWMAASVGLAMSGLGLVPAAIGGPLLGLYLAAFGAEVFYLWIASMRHSVSMAVVLGLLDLSLLLLCIGLFAPSTALVAAGGWAAIVSGICAGYTAAAHVINDTFGSQALPIWPSRPPRR